MGDWNVLKFNSFENRLKSWIFCVYSGFVPRGGKAKWLNSISTITWWTLKMRVHYGCNRPKQDVTPEGLNIVYTIELDGNIFVTTFTGAFRLSLRKCLYCLPNLPPPPPPLPITHIKWCTVTKAKAKVKQFSKRWWKRKPLKMLFVYMDGKQRFFLSPLVVYIFMLFTSALYTNTHGVRKMKLQANRNRLF